MYNRNFICSRCGSASAAPVEDCPACGQITPISHFDEEWLRKWAPDFAAACTLTAKDHSLLSGLIERYPDQDPFVRTVARAKLLHARVVLTEDVEPDVVTLHARVAYRLDGRVTETAVLGAWDEPAVPAGRLALRTRRGITLLGMKAGDRAEVLRLDRRYERLEVEEVLYQNERAHRVRSRLAASPSSASGGVIAFPARRSIPTHGGPDDDPGPSAA